MAEGQITVMESKSKQNQFKIEMILLFDFFEHKMNNTVC